MATNPYTWSQRNADGSWVTYDQNNQVVGGQPQGQPPADYGVGDTMMPPDYAPYGFGNTDPAGDARRAQSGGIQSYNIDPTGLQVSPDINDAYTGMLNINGAPTRISVTPDGKIFDEMGQDITSRFGEQDLATMRGAFSQAAQNPNYAPTQAAQQPPLPGQGPAGGTPPPPSGGQAPPPPSGGGMSMGSQGFVPFDPSTAPNAGYMAGPGQTGGNSGYQNFRYGFTGGPVNGASQYGYGVQPNFDASGDNINTKVAADRNLAIAGGAQIGQDLTNYANYYQGQASDFQDQLASAYDPTNPANMGYTDAEKNAILNNPYLQSLQLSPEEAQSNYLTDNERGGIEGDPYAPWNYVSSAANSLDTLNNDFTNTIRGDLSGQESAINNVTGQTAGALRGAVGNQFGMESSYVDPNKLTLSNEYQQNYNVTPADLQAIRDKAGRGVRAQEQADEDALNRAANAQGNTSPLALATMRDRLRQTGAINQANAMSDADIKARQLQLATTQQRENTRLGAEQGYAGMGIGVASDLGAAARGAEQYLGSQGLAAQQYLGQSRIGAEQSNAGRTISTGQFNTGLATGTLTNAEQQAANRAAQVAGNRQQVNQYNQGQQYGRGQYIYGQGSQANTNFANTRLGGLHDYRTGYLTPQQAQANQNVNLANNQRNTNFGNWTGAVNQASSNAVANSKTPDQAVSLLGGFGLAKGGVLKGPQLALVGESGPELIVDLDRVPQYGDGGVTDWQNPYDAQSNYLGGSDLGGGYGQGGDSGEADYTGNALPTGGWGATKANSEAPSNPYWNALKKTLYDSASSRGGGGGGGGGDTAPVNPNGLGGQLLHSGMSMGLAALGLAKGGIVNPHHPYGKRGMPKMELVTHPQIRVLGQQTPQAVVPLRRKPGNNVDVEDIPGLVRKYGR